MRRENMTDCPWTPIFVLTVASTLKNSGDPLPLQKELLLRENLRAQGLREGTETLLMQNRCCGEQIQWWKSCGGVGHKINSYHHAEVIWAS